MSGGSINLVNCFIENNHAVVGFTLGVGFVETKVGGKTVIPYS
jgi:hypothetical protein